MGLYLICDGANTNGVPNNHDVQTDMPLGKVQFSRERLKSVRKDAECTFGILKRGGTEESHASPSQRKNFNIVFTCAILLDMLIEHDKWQDEDDDDVAANFPEYSMDQRIIDLCRCPADSSHVGSSIFDNCDVEVECEWTQQRGALI
jgi:hypothetical protein